MRSIYRLLVGSGLGRARAFFAVLRAGAALRRKIRQERVETLLMQRKELCEIKDAVIDFAADFTRKRGKTTDQISKAQIVDDLYRREHNSRLFDAALKELVAEGYLKPVPAEMKDIVYATTRKRYISRTQRLTKTLIQMGVYARFLAQHRPYHEPRNYDI